MMESKLLFVAVLFIQIYEIYTNCYDTLKASPYIHDFSLQSPANISNNTQFNIPGCKPVKIWVIIRHGTRRPGNRILNASECLNQVRDEMTKTDKICQENFDLIKNWQLNRSFIPKDLAYPQGWIDQRELAKTWKVLYPTLFVDKYSPQTYKFGHTSTLRTGNSCKAFTQGLFGKSENYENVQRIVNDLLLWPYMNCSSFLNYAKSIKLNETHMIDFENTKDFKQLSDSIFEMLGLNRSQYDANTIIAMWYQCTFTQAANLAEFSPWCAVFNSKQLAMLGYLNDIQNYYKASYGYINRNRATRLPCAAILDMIEFLKTSSSTDPTKVTAYFSHSTMLLMMFTTFRTFFDPLPLLGINYYQQHNRLFRTNKMAPFATSFAAVKYECSTDNSSKILFLHNQKPLSMIWCKLGAICTIDEIENLYQNSPMKNCPCNICGQTFANLSAAVLPKSLLTKANLDCIRKNAVENFRQINSSIIVPTNNISESIPTIYLNENALKTTENTVKRDPMEFSVESNAHSCFNVVNSLKLLLYTMLKKIVSTAKKFL